jgi:hypothetical protein
MKNYINNSKLLNKITAKAKETFLRREEGLDGILVTIGLCIIALVLCIVMRDAMGGFITTIVTNMTAKANQILSSTVGSVLVLASLL